MQLKEFNNLEDLQRNFGGTFIVYDGKLSWCQVWDALGGNLFLDLTPVDNSGQQKPEAIVSVDANSEELKNTPIRFPKLGWVKYRSGYYYLYRSTKRQYKFGICNGNVLAMQYVPGAGVVKFGVWTAFTKEVLYHLVRPSQKFTGKGSQVLSLEFAVFEDKAYKGIHEIGAIVNGVCKLHPSFDDSITVMDLKELGVSFGD